MCFKLVVFLVAMMKFWQGIFIEERACLGLCNSWEHSPSGQGRWSSWSQYVWSEGARRETLVLSLFVLFIQSRTITSGRVLCTFRFIYPPLLDLCRKPFTDMSRDCLQHDSRAYWIDLITIIKGSPNRLDTRHPTNFYILAFHPLTPSCELLMM